MKKFIVFSLSLILAGVLSACGGGGGGGPSFSSLNYVGATTQATITDINAIDFGVAFLEGGTIPSQSFAGAIQPGTTTPGTLQHQTAQKIITDTTREILLKAIKRSTNSPVAISSSFSGDCPGHPGSSSISGTESATSFDFTVTYNHYCFGDINDPNWGFELTLHGKVHLTGTQQQVTVYDTLADDGSTYIESLLLSMTQDIVSMETTFTMDNGGIIETYSHTMSGIISITYEPVIVTDDGTVTGVPGTVIGAYGKAVSFNTTFNFTDAAGRIYRIEDMVNYGFGSLSGRLYHPDDGYVDVSTVPGYEFTLYGNNTLFNKTDDKYCGGKLKITDINGDYIIFTADSACSSFTVEFFDVADTPIMTYGTNGVITGTWP